ncbi:MAG: hypothetical protein DI570_03985 [Phenylobacterium zucineum]|nr:MAG: hypothetical protein DI570_03985 [Phenylobacterium zucineum]
MKLRFALVVLGIAGASATGAAAATATANANATIVAPAQLSVTRDLEFGSIARPTVGTTTVTVLSASTGSATPQVSGGNGFVPTPGQARAATFRLIGTNGQTYSVAGNALSFTGATGNLSNVASQSPVAAGGTVGTLPANGQDDLYVGGHFDITPTTALQAYTGSLTLTVNFN